MATEVKGFAEHFAGFRRHLKLAAATFAVVMLFGIGFSVSLPDVYRASAFILVEDPDIPEEIVRSTVTTYTTRQLTTLNEKILTIQNLVRMIEDFDLYVDERRSTPVELLAVEMRQKISIDIQQRDSVGANGLPSLQVVGFSISFEDESPEVTKAVVDELANLYLENNIRVRSEQTAETEQFLAGEIARLEGEISVLEGELAEFKEVNADRLPSMTASNMTMMSRIDQDLMNIEQQRAVLDQNRLSIEAQLSTVEPSVAVRLADGSIALSPQDQLKALTTQLSIYESKYSDDHPDVIAARRDIESIKKRFGIDVDLQQLEDSIVATKADLAKAQEKYTDDHPDVVALQNRLTNLEQERNTTLERQLESKVTPDNPAYISLESAIDRLDAEKAALNLKERELRSRMADYETRLMETPNIEKELAALTRKLSSTSNRYWVLRDKQFAAEMGVTLESQNKGEEMVLIEPARVPLKPFKPNRPAIITLTFLFALVAGVGITQLVDALDKSIRDSAGIISVQGVSPLVEIPYIYNDAELEQALKLRKMAIAAVPAMVLVMVVIVHFVLQPLDVLFYALAARLGF
jgi:uncharacterized protein involved in exopolysaccharide biosynthesis